VIYSSYFIIFIFLTLIIIGGYESTLRLISYVDLIIRFEIIKIKMRFLKRKLEKELNLPSKDWRDSNGKY
jgi:hypothetical protein